MIVFLGLNNLCFGFYNSSIFLLSFSLFPSQLTINICFSLSFPCPWASLGKDKLEKTNGKLIVSACGWEKWILCQRYDIPKDKPSEAQGSPPPSHFLGIASLGFLLSFGHQHRIAELRSTSPWPGLRVQREYENWRSQLVRHKIELTHGFFIHNLSRLHLAWAKASVWRADGEQSLATWV